MLFSLYQYNTDFQIFQGKNTEFMRLKKTPKIHLQFCASRNSQEVTMWENLSRNSSSCNDENYKQKSTYLGASVGAWNPPHESIRQNSFIRNFTSPRIPRFCPKRFLFCRSQSHSKRGCVLRRPRRKHFPERPRHCAV